MHDGQSLGASGSTRLVGVPRLLAVVAEVHATSGTLAVQLRTTGAAAGDYCIPNDTRQTQLEIIQHTALGQTTTHRDTAIRGLHGVGVGGKPTGLPP